MSDDTDFLALTQSLDKSFARRVIAVHMLKRLASVTSCLVGLLIVALFLVLTNSTAGVVTTTVAILIIVEMFRRSYRGTKPKSSSNGKQRLIA